MTKETTNYNKMILSDKIDIAINKIKNAEYLALKYTDFGFHLAFSGGKDSQVIYELCKMAGVKFKAVMNITTIDPPELLRFIRKNYSDVEFIRPELNFYKLILKKGMLPTRQARFCCQYLKEQSGAGTVTVIGIRKSESNRRKKREELEISHNNKKAYSNTLDQFNIDNENQVLCIKGKDKILFSPIIYWSEKDVWDFIKLRNLEYCSLYDTGYKRIGCIFCPMANVKAKRLDLINYPGIAKHIKKSIQSLRDKNIYMNFTDVDDTFNWWISNKNVTDYLECKKQIKLEL